MPSRRAFLLERLATQVTSSSARSTRKERIIVGVNKFAGDYPEVPVEPINPEVERIQAERLARVRSERDPKAVEAALNGLREAAKRGHNTMPAFMAAAHAYCTLGEQMDVLREVYGVYEEPVLI